MNKYMSMAINAAKKAYSDGEIPVGAVIVKDNEIISISANTVEKEKCALCHAEINAIKVASQICGKYLDDCDIYVTIEPCAMCTGAIINSRIKRLYIGADEPKTGCCGSKFDLVTKNHFNHNIEVYYGIMEKECKKLIQDFFSEIRQK